MKLKKKNAKKAGKMLIINVERCVVFAVIVGIVITVKAIMREIDKEEGSKKEAC